jgi:hypothetical protein
MPDLDHRMTRRRGMGPPPSGECLTTELLQANEVRSANMLDDDGGSGSDLLGN